MHAEKTSGRIGKSFPDGSYGAYQSLIITFDDIQLFLHLDQFYVFSPRAVPPPPTILPASELTPELDLVGAALSRDSPASEEVVSLTSGKSGLRLGFATNRASLVLPSQVYTS